MKQYIYKQITSLLLVLALIVTMAPMVFADNAAYTVTLDKTTLSLAVGEKQKLTAAVKKTADNSSVTGAVYTSDTPEKAKVDPATGEVTGVAAGTAIIKAVYTDTDKKIYEASCTVTITATVPVGTVSIVNNLIKDFLDVGEPDLVLVAEVGPENASNKTLKWTSSDPSVATVTPAVNDNLKGVVKAVGPGKATITAESSNGKSAKVEIEVSGITMKDTMGLLVGRNETLVPGYFGAAKDYVAEWSTTNISVAAVKTGRVVAYNPGTTVVKVTAGRYTASCTVTVKEDVADAIEQSMIVGEELSFSNKIIQSIKKLTRERLGAELEYVTGLSVPTGHGILYYGYTSPDIPGSGVGSSERYYLNAAPGQRSLSDVSFVPDGDFGEIAIIEYTGCAEGRTFLGSIRVKVENSGDVSYSTAEGRVLPFDVEDFAAVCKRKNGRALRYVTFTLPAETKGTLYYNYSSIGQFSQRVSGDAKYYVIGGSMLIENIAFSPADGFTGKVEIPYYATDSSGATYGGKVTVGVYSVTEGGQGGSEGSGTPDIVYQGSVGYSVRFDDDDFRDACVEATGSGLNYIYLTQPSASEGALYYDYSGTSYEEKISESTRYFRSSSPRISKIDFVPRSGYTGTATIPYVGYSTDGTKFEGRVIIRMSGGVGTVKYAVTRGRAVDFNGLDFNEACIESNGAELYKLAFSQPASSQGTLYYSYGNSANKGSKVDESSRYTVSRISNITFVPKSGYSGTVSIPFSGQDSNGDRFSGVVEIEVDSSYNDNGDSTIRYSAFSGGTVNFKGADFQEVSALMTGEYLNYVRFTLPDSTCGTLREESRTGREVNNSTGYYASGGVSMLDDVLFVASSGYTGQVEIPYTAWTSSGSTFDGRIAITVTAPVSSTVTYRGRSVPIRFTAQSFREACAGLLPESLSYIQINSVPNSVYGKLMQNYSKPNTGTAVTVGSKFYQNGAPSIEDLTFIPKMGYQGSVNISYTAVDIKGNVLEGTANIVISDSYFTSSFTDLTNYSWAAPSIEFLTKSGVVSGYGNGKYGPADSTSKGAFTLMVCRLFNLPQQSGENFVDVPADNDFAKEILTAKVLGIAEGETKKDGEYFYPNAAITRQQALYMLEKAMKAGGREVAVGSPVLLTIYNDGDQVADYARSAMASMIKMGIITGDPEGNLNPAQSITRAEMAVILHKVLTM